MQKFDCFENIKLHNMPCHKEHNTPHIVINYSTVGVTFMSFSRISHENIPGFCLLSSSILASTSGVATLGFDPPITPGLMDPVSCVKCFNP